MSFFTDGLDLFVRNGCCHVNTQEPQADEAKLQDYDFVYFPLFELLSLRTDEP